MPTQYYTSYKELVKGSSLATTGLGNCEPLVSKFPDCNKCAHVKILINIKNF